MIISITASEELTDLEKSYSKMNMILAILSVLFLLLSLVTGLPVEPDVQLMAAFDDSEVHNREVR